MTKKPEKILVLKERYLLLTDYDVIKAEILHRLDLHGGWKQISRTDLGETLIMSVTDRTLRRKMTSLESDGLIESDSSTRPHRYRVAQDLPKQIENLSLNMVVGVISSVDEFAGFDRNLVYESGIISGQSGHLKSQSCNNSEDSVTLSGQSGHLEDESEDISGQSGRLNDELSGQVGRLSDETSGQSGRLTKKRYNKELYTTDSKLVDTKAESELVDEVGSDSVVTEADTTPQSPEPSTNPITDVNIQNRKNRYYDWTHYDQFSKEEWQKACEELVWPGKESGKTLLIGAYLIGMKRKHGVEIGLAAGDFGKYLRLAKKMWEFFTDKHGDEVKGFNEALAWIKEFINFPPDSFAGKASWPIQMCFTRDMYRQKGLKSKTGKKRNDTGTVIFTQEQREERWKKSRRVTRDEILGRSNVFPRDPEED